MADGDAIGSRLKAARNHLGITVVQAAERSRVDAAVIVALESGHFTSIGPPVFVRGHLARYARTINENAEELLSIYNGLDESGIRPDLTRAPRPKALGAQIKNLKLRLLVVAMVAVLITVVWWALTIKAGR